MSDLQRKFLRAKLFKPPNMPPPLPFDEDDDNDHDEAYDEFPDSSSVSSASSTSTIRASQFARPELKSKSGSQQHEPVPWSVHWSQKLKLAVSSASSTPTTIGNIANTNTTAIPTSEPDIFNAYLTPPTLTGPLFITHHGAGSSGLSFSTLASEIRKILPSAGILSPDCRGHGETHTHNDEDLSLTTLSNDLYNVIEATRMYCGWKQFPDFVLVGHSLGGAVVVELAKNGRLGGKVRAYAVVDVVEGSAIDALQSMQTYLSTRPSTFPSLTSAIDWHLRSRTIRNPDSACASVPALLVPEEKLSDGKIIYKWRTDLARTQPFWEGWFVGLSKKFLEARGGKLLLLAGTDRLDRELMIGQMQGKYQLLVFPEVGHFVHEDAPEKTAMALVDFWKRQAPLVLPPKVGQMKLGQLKA